MYAKQHHLSLELELIRWLAVLALAGILALAVAREATGTGIDQPPLMPPTPVTAER